MDILTNLQKLPSIAYIDNTNRAAHSEIDAPVVAVRRGVAGCYAIHTRQTAAELNDAEGTTPAQAAAMYAGSLFGWDVPAADPDNYDEQGVFSHDARARL
jgi:hypothetical protein